MTDDPVAASRLRDPADGRPADGSACGPPVTFGFETAFRHVMQGRAVTRIDWRDLARVVRVGPRWDGGAEGARAGLDLAEADYAAEDWFVVGGG